MAKTFDPNRVLPGTIELVKDANGNYTTKVVGLETINSLSLPDISTTAAVTKTDTDTKTATDITGDTIQKQTQMAFKTGDDNQPDTTGSMLQDEAKKTSGMLSDTFANTKGLMTSDDAYRGVDNRFDAEKFDETEDKVSIKDPTESVFGRSTLEDEQRERQTILPDLNVGKKTDRVTSADVQLGKAEPPGFDLTGAFDFLKGDRFKTEKGTSVNVDKGRGSELGEKYRSGDFTPDTTDIERRQQRQLGMTDEERRQQFQLGSLGISADPSKTRAAKEADFASGTITPRVPDAIIEGQPSLPAKKTFAQSVSTALKGVGEAVQMMSPIMGIIRTLGATRNESESTIAFNKGRFNIVTSSGPMQGRIVGDRGEYDPANNLFHGMNRSSALGNLEKAGQKRIR